MAAVMNSVGDAITIIYYLTLSHTGFFRLVLHGGGGGHKVPAAFFSETVKATATKLGTLTN